MSHPSNETLPRSHLPYRLYCFDGNNRRQPAELINADDDAMVIALAWLQLNNHGEIWQADRLVFVEPSERATA